MDDRREGTSNVLQESRNLTIDEATTFRAGPSSFVSSQYSVSARDDRVISGRSLSLFGEKRSFLILWEVARFQ